MLHVGTFETGGRALIMFAYRRRPEVIGTCQMTKLTQTS